MRTRVSVHHVFVSGDQGKNADGCCTVFDQGLTAENMLLSASAYKIIDDHGQKRGMKRQRKSERYPDCPGSKTPNRCRSTEN